MDTSWLKVFVRTCLILLFHVKFSVSDDFDVTTLYNFQETVSEADGVIYNRIPSNEIHVMNNARGLPVLFTNGSVLDPSLQVSDFVGNSSKLTVSNLSGFTHHVLRSPFHIKVKTKTDTRKIGLGNEPQLQPFHEKLSFTFSSGSSTGELRIYLMDSPEGLSGPNLYYIIISNHYYTYYGKLYRCPNGYSSSYIDIAPDKMRLCKLVSQNYAPHRDWSGKCTFLVKKIKTYVEVKMKMNDVSEHIIFSWNDNYPLDISYYAIESSVSGEITTNLDPEEEHALILTEKNGSIVSETFIPHYREACVSVVYHAKEEDSIALQIVKDDGEKFQLKEIQTTSLDYGWASSIYGAKLPQETTYSPVKIELTAEASAPAEILNKTIVDGIAVLLISGCNGEGQEEDIYVLPSDETLRNMNFYAYDVAVKRSPSSIKEELQCMNGGMFDNERNSCICPAGFTGKICELGCGPDRYGSTCNGHCSKTKKGCREMKLCRPKLGCLCAPGLKNSLCDTACSRGEYGADCKQVCGKCINGSCDIYTGRCYSGCQEGFYPPFCQTHYKYLKKSLKVVSSSYHTLEVTFDSSPENMEGSGTPKFYQFQIKDEENQSSWTELEPVLLPTAETVEGNMTNLNPGTNYTIRVVLLDIDGNSYQEHNIPVVHGSTKCLVPKVDYKLNTTKIGQNEFEVEWEYTVESNLWCKLTHFEVEMKTGWKWQQYYKGSEMGYTFSDMLPGERYKVRVRGISINGPLAYSEPLIVTTEDEALQIVPEASIASRKPNQLEVKWKEPFYQRGKIQKYRVKYECQKLLACNENCSYFFGDVAVRKPSVILEGLVPHTQYLIRIAANSGSYGPDVQLLATTDMTEPEISASMSASTVAVRTNSSLTVQWEKPKNCTYINGYFYGYQYELFEPKNPTPLYEGSTDNTSATFVNLHPHTDYTVKVYLKTSGGISKHPLIINASTAFTAPEKVEDLTVYKVGRRLIGLRWRLPKEMPGKIKSFTISYKSAHQKATKFIVKPVPCIPWPELYCHSINSLRPDTEYTLTVQARNEEVNEDGEIALIVATTKESAPLAPDYIKSVSQTETSLTVEWGIPKLLNGILRSFLVNIEQTDAVNTSDCCQYFPIKEIPVEHERASYQITLNNLKPASTYAVSVTAKTMILGPAVSITAHTRPPAPSMNETLKIVDSDNSSELEISSTPKLTINSTSINKDLLKDYLVVVIPESAELSVEVTPISNEWLAQELEQVINSTFYIAAELNQVDLEDDSAEVVLGKESSLRNGKWSMLWNPALKYSEKYHIGLVAILDYCGVLNIGYIETDLLTVTE